VGGSLCLTEVSEAHGRPSFVGCDLMRVGVWTQSANLRVQFPGYVAPRRSEGGFTIFHRCLSLLVYCQSIPLVLSRLMLSIMCSDTYRATCFNLDVWCSRALCFQSADMVLSTYLLSIH
jgi:hypothetical protein